MPSSGVQPGFQESCTEHQANPILNDSAGYNTTSSAGTVFVYNNTYSEPTVVRVSTWLRMWYYGKVDGDWGIYTATSQDGANWTVGRIPALTRGANGSWDSGSVSGPSVLYNGTGYLMYFGGNNGTSIHSQSIGLAFSADGIQWTEYAGNPVLRPGPDGYDSEWIKNANVVLRNGTYWMWYTGQSSSTYRTPGGIYPLYAINLATSNDGVHWTKYPGNPVFLGAPDQILLGKSVVGHPDVLEANGTLLLLYGDGYSIRYAVSNDGIAWTTTANYLVDSAQADWKSFYTSEPAALINGSRLTLWYYGFSGQTSTSSPYIEGIGLAYCSLLMVPVVVTTTTTAISANTATSLTTTTQSVTAIQTQEAPSPELGYYQLATMGLAVVAALLALATLLRRR